MKILTFILFSFCCLFLNAQVKEEITVQQFKMDGKSYYVASNIGPTVTSEEAKILADNFVFNNIKDWHIPSLEEALILINAFEQGLIHSLSENSKKDNGLIWGDWEIYQILKKTNKENWTDINGQKIRKNKWGELKANVNGVFKCVVDSNANKYVSLAQRITEEETITPDNKIYNVQGFNDVYVNPVDFYCSISKYSIIKGVKLTKDTKLNVVLICSIN